MVNKKLLAALATSFVIVPTINITVSANETTNDQSFELLDIQSEEDWEKKCQINGCVSSDEDIDNDESKFNPNENDNIEKLESGTEQFSKEEIVIDEDKISDLEENIERLSNNLDQNSNEDLITDRKIDQINIDLGGLELEGDFSWQAPAQSKIKIESVSTRPNNLRETYDRHVQVDYYSSKKDHLNHFVDFYIESEKCNWTKYNEETLVWIYKLEEGNQPMFVHHDYTVFYLSHVGGIIKNNKLTYKFYTNVNKLTYSDLFKPYGTVATCSYECPIQNDGTLFFSDVNKNVWYYDSVKKAYTAQLMTGIDKTHFAPNNPMTRGMVTTVLYRMTGAPKVEYEHRFSDVKSGLWYSNAITWASRQGIVSGYQNGKFGADDYITREQLAVMIRNYLNKMGLKTNSTQSLEKFKDSKQVSDFARSALQFCVEKGILSGADNGTKLNPGNTATRAEGAKLLLNTSNMLQNSKLSAAALALSDFDNYPISLALETEVSTLSLERSYSNPFKDVKSSDWFYNIALEANAKKLITGLNSNTFAPYQNMTRGMMATVLYRMAGAPDLSYLPNYFDDVKNGIWYTEGIKWTSTNEIMSGYGNRKFGPDDYVTREQMAVVLRNFLLKMGYQQPNTNLISKYSDSKSISPYARSAVEFCLANGLMSGTAKGNRINPGNKATRAECAKMIVLTNRKLENLERDNIRIKYPFKNASGSITLPLGSRYYGRIPAGGGPNEYIINGRDNVTYSIVIDSPVGPTLSNNDFKKNIQKYHPNATFKEINNKMIASYTTLNSNGSYKDGTICINFPSNYATYEITLSRKDKNDISGYSKNVFQELINSCNEGIYLG